MQSMLDAHTISQTSVDTPSEAASVYGTASMSPAAAARLARGAARPPTKERLLALATPRARSTYKGPEPKPVPFPPPLPPAPPPKAKKASAGARVPSRAQVATTPPSVAAAAAARAPSPALRSPPSTARIKERANASPSRSPQHGRRANEDISCDAVLELAAAFDRLTPTKSQKRDLLVAISRCLSNVLAADESGAADAAEAGSKVGEAERMANAHAPQLALRITRAVDALLRRANDPHTSVAERADLIHLVAQLEAAPLVSASAEGAMGGWTPKKSPSPTVVPSLASPASRASPASPPRVGNTHDVVAEPSGAWTGAPHGSPEAAAAALQEQLLEQCREMREMVEHENAAITAMALEQLNGRRTGRRRGASAIFNGEASRLIALFAPLLVIIASVSIALLWTDGARLDGANLLHHTVEPRHDQYAAAFASPASSPEARRQNRRRRLPFKLPKFFPPAALIA